MNADPTDTRYPHLDLGDLIAGAAGQPVGNQAREHLARCEHCQSEANRWNLVAETGSAAWPEAPQPVRPRRTRRHVLPRPVRHGLLAAGSVAAALVLLVAIGSAAGVVHVHFGGSGGSDHATHATPARGPCAHRRIGKGKGLLAPLDRRGDRRDQCGARLRQLIRQTPTLAGTALPTRCQPAHARTGAHR